MPGQFGKQTISKHVHATIKTTTNILGNISIIFSPYYYHDDATTYTGFLVNNVATYDGVSVFGTGHQYIATPMSTPSGNVSEYRLVSASMQIVPQVAPLNATGKLGGGVTDQGFTANTVGTNSNTYNNLATFSIVNNIMPYAEADACDIQSLRLVWRPCDNLDFGMYDINEPNNQGGVSIYRETLLVAYGTGFPATTNLNVELYWNFEYVPLPGSINTGCGTYCGSSDNPADILKKNLLNSALWAHPFKKDAHEHLFTGLLAGGGGVSKTSATLGSMMNYADPQTVAETKATMQRLFQGKQYFTK